MIALNLWNALREKLPEGYGAVVDLDVRLRDTPLLVRQPDVIVFRKDGRSGKAPLRAHSVLPGSVTVDRVDKPAEYAAAGIPHFWRLEHGFGLTLFADELAANGSAYTAPASFDLKYVASKPFEINLDVQALSVE